MFASRYYLLLPLSLCCVWLGCADADKEDTGPTLTVEVGDVVINELLPDPEGEDAGKEWLELYNNTDTAIDISGWYLHVWKSASSTSYTDPLPEGTVIDAGGYLVIGEEDIDFADVTLGLNMGNGGGGDAVYLYAVPQEQSNSSDGCGCRRSKDSSGSSGQDSADVMMDYVVYGGSNEDGALDMDGDVAESVAPALKGDHPLVRCCETGLSGEDFFLMSPDDATPGALNDCPIICIDPSSSADVTVVMNELMPNPEGSDAGKEWIELYNAGTTTANVCGWEIHWFKGDPLNPSGTYTILVDDEVTGSTTLLPGEFLLIAGPDAGLVPDFEADLDMGNGTNGDAVHLVDADGTVADAVCYGSNNDDGMLNEHGEVCESMAANPGDGRPLTRCPEDGEDTDQSGEDFWHLEAGEETPGYENYCPGATDDCDLADEVGVVMNEAMVNPAGADADKEWVELYNPESFDVDISGWTVAWFKGDPDSPSGSETIPEDTWIPAGGFLLLGGSEMTGGTPDVVLEFDFGNGTNGDGIHLRDCTGALRDALVYAPPNDDGIRDESGAAATSVAPKPGEESLARYPDGYDTDQSGDDFCVPAASTPGEPNEPCATTFR